MAHDALAELRSLRRQVEALTRANDHMVRSLERRPLRSANGTYHTYTLLIIDGQTVYSDGTLTYYGVSFSASPIATVPSVYDPTVSTTPGTFTAITGIGRAFLYIDNVLQTNPVLCVHQNTTSPFAYACVSADVVIAGLPISIPTADGTASVTAYPLALL